MSASRIRILEDGALEIVDPRWEDAELLRALDPGYEVRSEPLEGFTGPRFQSMRDFGCGYATAEIEPAPLDRLWAMHNYALDAWRRSEAAVCASGEQSILALKCEIARRLLRRCVLCARRCGVDRTAGDRGFCGLDAEAILAESFVHIGEEPPINPSHVISLAGCGLRCRFCQQSSLLFPEARSRTPLNRQTWETVDTGLARSISFLGGNPDESAPAILDFLHSAPSQFSLPVVWNSNAYSSPETLALLDGVVDVYLPDLKYADDACAKRWSNAEGYYQAAQGAIRTMTEQGVLVIVRILLLPGHLECCHLPALEFLARLPRLPLVSLRGQYSPDWRIADRDGRMASRLPAEELARAGAAVRALGLALIE